MLSGTHLENPTGGYFSGGACAARAAWARVQRVRTLSALHDRKRRSQSAACATLRASTAFSPMLCNRCANPTWNGAKGALMLAG